MLKSKKIGISILSILILTLSSCSTKNTSPSTNIVDKDKISNNEPENEKEDIVEKAKSNGTFVHCGVERWSVKTGTDKDANKVDLKNVTKTTIEALNKITPPDPNTIKIQPRISPTETTVFSIDATLSEFRGEADSDYHLILKDNKGNVMIAEIPSPDCVGNSPFAASIAAARKSFDAKFNVIVALNIDDPFQEAGNVAVKITGVGFFDFPHGQTGLAKNAIELHPVLSIEFNSK